MTTRYPTSIPDPTPEQEALLAREPWRREVLDLCKHIEQRMWGLAETAEDDPLADVRMDAVVVAAQIKLASIFRRTGALPSHDLDWQPNGDN